MLNRMVLTILLGSLSGILGGVGTTLLSLLPPISLLGVIEYYKRKKVDTLVGIILCITYFIFAYYGSIINKMYSDKTLKFYTGILFLIISFYFLWESIKKV